MRTIELFRFFEDKETLQAFNLVLWIEIHKTKIVFKEEYSTREDDGYWEEFPIENIKTLKVSEELSLTLLKLSEKEALDKIKKLLEPDFVEYLSDYKIA